MTASGTGIRRQVLPANEQRRLDEYPRETPLSEAELLRGHGIRLDMLRGLGDAPACPYREPGAKCPCGGHAR